MNPALINFVYIIASILFILGIKMLGKAETARKGNMLSSIGMLIAVVITLFDKKILDCTDPMSWGLLVGGLVLGAVIGVVVAKVVKMTSMPEMVALLNGFGGLASLLVAVGEYHYDMVLNKMPDDFSKFAIIATILIGGITFTGSVMRGVSFRVKFQAKQKFMSGKRQSTRLSHCSLSYRLVCSSGLDNSTWATS
ncbi:MAG: NAD(P)(+) transhydrogenase (Re/Si-specific) subunit beta [Opitutales bacterium]|nr:NAD(P)(+) transhydrogenase (Re/Si-specific) subunit beta [Opitutales bacterium]